jgi:hypothetical protein
MERDSTKSPSKTFEASASACFASSSLRRGLQDDLEGGGVWEELQVQTKKEERCRKAESGTLDSSSTNLLVLVLIRSVAVEVSKAVSFINE